MTQDASQQDPTRMPLMPLMPDATPEERARLMLRNSGKFSIEVALSEALTLMGRHPVRLGVAFVLVMLLYLVFQTPYFLSQILTGEWQRTYEMLHLMGNNWEGFSRQAETLSQETTAGLSANDMLGVMLSVVGGILYAVFFGPIWAGFYLLVLRLLRGEKSVDPGLVFAGFGRPLFQLILVSVGISLAYVVVTIVAALIGLAASFLIILLATVTAEGSGMASLTLLLLAVPVVLLLMLAVNVVLCLFNYAVPLAIDHKLDFWNAIEVGLRLVWRRLLDVFLWRIIAILILLIAWVFVGAGLFFGVADWSTVFVGAWLFFSILILAFAFLLTTLADLSVYDQMYSRPLRESP